MANAITSGGPLTKTAIPLTFSCKVVATSKQQRSVSASSSRAYRMSHESSSPISSRATARRSGRSCPGWNTASTDTSTIAPKTHTNPLPAGEADAGVQVPWARTTVSRRVWSYYLAFPTVPSSLLRVRIPSRDAEKIPDVGRDHRYRDICLRVELVYIWSPRALLLHRNEIRINKLSTP
jgi:hypothetical protein